MIKVNELLKMLFWLARRSFLALFATLVFSAGLLQAQDSDSSDDDDSDTSSEASVTSPVGPESISVSVVDNNSIAPTVDPTTLSLNNTEDFFAQQAFAAVTNPFGGYPGPIPPLDDFNGL